MADSSIIELFDISWTCPTAGCGEDYGNAYQEADLSKAAPYREICWKCGQSMRLEYDGEKMHIVGHPEVKVRSRTLRVSTSGGVTFSGSLYGYPAEYYPQEIYRDARDGLQRLAATDIEDGLGDLMHRIVFQQYITILETLLHDAIVLAVNSEPMLANEIVLRTNFFRDRTVSMMKIAAEPDYILKEVIGYLRNLSWHDFKKAEPIFKAVFDEELFEDANLRERLIAATHVRHDIVHRNGRTKERQEIQLTRSDISRLAMDVNTFAEYICDVFEAWNQQHMSTAFLPVVVDMTDARTHEKLAR